MTAVHGGHRGTLAAVAAAVFGAIGVLVLTFAVLTSHHAPPGPTAAQRGRVPVAHPHRAVPARPAATDRAIQPPATAHRGPVLSRSRPVRLAIHAIGVDTQLLQLGLNSDGTLQTPWKPLQAGWYRQSPTPGQLGPSVIAGHVDSYQTGPAVFYRLAQLSPGNRIVVTRADGRNAKFAVDAVRAYPKAKFPTQTVYGDTDRAELRLITCGDWNPDRKEYDGNVVAFAHLVAPRSGH